MNMKPFTIFNCNPAKRDKTFKVTIELPSIILVQADPVTRSCMNSHIVGYSLVKVSHHVRGPGGTELIATSGSRCRTFCAEGTPKCLAKTLY